jgi:hypothetical protein
MKRRLNWVMLCIFESGTFSFWSSSLLSENIKTRIYKTKILPFVLYGCETWSLTLRKEHRLRVFEKKALSRISGPRRDEVTGGWRKMHNKSFITCTCTCVKYKWNDQVKDDEMGRTCSINGEGGACI